MWRYWHSSIAAILLVRVAVSSVLREEKFPWQCTCEDAALRSAPFVLTWMTSWGEDDLFDLHPNEVLNKEDIISSTTAQDADVDVDVFGLHCVCALQPGTNLTQLLAALPQRTMVLSVLQSPGCNLTVIGAEDLSNLVALKALHLQGYAHRDRRQVSGYRPNSVDGIVEHKELLDQEFAQDEGEETKDLRLAITNDALLPLASLQLLDLQFVRLVASVDFARARRHTEPTSSTTLLDLPLHTFLSLTNQLSDPNLPPDLLPPTMREQPQEDYDEEEEVEELTREGEEEEYEVDEYSDESPFDTLRHISDRFSIVTIKDDQEDKSLVSYEVYKSETEPQLAPFTGMSQLKYLRVAHARLDRVGPELLSGLDHLHTLTLEYNRIKVVPPAMFTPTPALRHLSFAHNNLMALDGESLLGLEPLLTLDLDFNQLSVIGPTTFPELPQLGTVRMLGNPITHVLPDAFVNINATEQLLLGSRDVDIELHVDSFRQLGNLKILQLENVTLLTLSRLLLEGMPSLEQLTIHGDIHSIDYDAFTAAPALQELNLSNCRLARLSMDAFYSLTSLQLLDLSHNSLDEIVPGTFDDLVNLRELYLNNNNLSTLPLGIFRTLPAKLIQLQDNPWHCSCSLLQLRPTVTNKVRRTKYLTCRWDEKLGTTCKPDVKTQLIYDGRVTPLCHTPVEHRGHVAFHVARKNLKCPKKFWDPRSFKRMKWFKARHSQGEEEEEEGREEKENQNIQWDERKKELDKEEKEKEIEEEEEEEGEEGEEDEESDDPNWLPLTAHTAPPPEVKDLFLIAMSEMPEDTIADDEDKTEAAGSDEVPVDVDYVTEDKEDEDDVDDGLDEGDDGVGVLDDDDEDDDDDDDEKEEEKSGEEGNKSPETVNTLPVEENEKFLHKKRNHPSSLKTQMVAYSLQKQRIKEELKEAKRREKERFLKAKQREKELWKAKMASKEEADRLRKEKEYKKLLKKEEIFMNKVPRLVHDEAEGPPSKFRKRSHLLTKEMKHKEQVFFNNKM
ncbi:uncharacterized protein LOC143026494 [Oratosquilla oratoria]|uniref:uncharacterized protein LOC143026494 n=1 Tax=Oratosquilla oratoria TaxID=337810 RepID=UPI003F764989